MELLELVQTTLGAMDSDEIESINDTTESAQVVDIAYSTYYELIERLSAEKKIDWLHGPLSLQALADPANPTQMRLTDAVRRVTFVSYNVANTGDSAAFQELKWQDPQCFLNARSASGDNRTLVTLGGVSFYVDTNRQPSFYTSFDDTTFVCDAIDLTVESTLQADKFSVLGYRHPVFQRLDSYVIDLPPQALPLFQAEVNIAAFNYVKQTRSGVDEKRSMEQTSQWRREKNRIAMKPNDWRSPYGRHR